VRALLALALAPLLLLGLYRFVPPPITPVMVVRWLGGDGLDRRWAALADLPAAVAAAVIAAEDSRFCSHFGFDWVEIQSALDQWRKGEALRGASTLSMQTGKNLFLWPGRSWLRKGAEAYLTVAIEVLWSKRRIVEVYLNIAEWGSGIFGIEAAARRHFGKPARALTRREAALLAAALPNPRQFSPGRPSAYLRERADTIAARIDQLGPLLDCVRPVK